MATRLSRSAQGVRALAWVLGVSLAGLHAYESRYLMNVDGVSYLDVAEAYRTGAWSAAINGHWSPLYSWIVALAEAVIRPAPFAEYPWVHAINVAIFVLALVSVDVLLREIIRADRAASTPDLVRLPDWGWMAVGYALALWTLLHLVTVWIVTPDMLVAAAVFLSLALVLRVWREPRLRTVALLGVVVGAGYLAKAPMLPLGVLMLASAVWAFRAHPRLALRAAALGIAGLLVVAAPFMIALSLQKGRLTFGDSRVVSYAWLVNQVPFRNWQGGAEAGGHLVHPPRKISDTPAAFEYATPLPGSYPVWYDPSYWLEGVEPQIRVRDHLRVLTEGAREYYAMVLGGLQASVPVIIGLCVYAGWPARARTATPLLLLMPAVAGLLLYAAVAVMPRYVGPFLAVFWLGLLAVIRLPATVVSVRLAAGTCVATALLLLGATALSAGPRAIGGIRQLVHGSPVGEPIAVASAVQAAGIVAGDRVAIVYPPPASASVARLVNWARPARVVIAAEVPPEASEAFWTAEAQARTQLLDTFRGLGIRAVVTMRIPPVAAAADVASWVPVDGTPFAILPLR